jgi:RNA polymerase sigma factor (sigma-70 family)
MSATSPDDLLAQHRPAMVAFARRFVPADDAEDVVQTASILIWTHHDTFSGRSSWLTWALAVVRYTALSHLRSEARRREVDATGAAMGPGMAFPDDPLLALSEEDHAWVESYLDGSAPGSPRTHRRKLRKIRLALRGESC